MTATPRHPPGGANVFADIGLPDAKTHLMKVQLVSRIQGLIRPLTNVGSADSLGL